MTTVDQTIGTRIRMFRTALGLSQTDLADYIGVRFQQIQKYESGKNQIPATRLEELAEALGVSVLMLLRDPNNTTEQSEDCAELLDLFLRLPQSHRAEILFQLRAKSARLRENIVAAPPPVRVETPT